MDAVETGYVCVREKVYQCLKIQQQNFPSKPSALLHYEQKLACTQTTVLTKTAWL